MLDERWKSRRQVRYTILITIQPVFIETQRVPEQGFVHSLPIWLCHTNSGYGRRPASQHGPYRKSKRDAGKAFRTDLISTASENQKLLRARLVAMSVVISMGNTKTRLLPQSPSNLHGQESFDSSVSGIVDAVLEVGRQRNALLEEMSAALQSGDEKQALRLARRLCGLSYEEKRS